MTLSESRNHSKDIPQYKPLSSLHLDIYAGIYDIYDRTKKVKMQQYFGLTLAKRRNGQTTGTYMHDG